MNTTKPAQTNQSIPSNSSWLKTFSIGFSIISVGITIAIIGYIVLTTKQTQPTNQQSISISPTIAQPSPTPSNETANWKTYIDNKNRFTFKYPANFRVSQSTEFIQVDLIQYAGMPGRWLRVSVTDAKNFELYPASLSSLEIGKSYKPYSDEPGTWTRLADIKIDNHQGKLFEGKNTGESPSPRRYIILSKNGFIYEINYIYNNATKDDRVMYPDDPENPIDFVTIFDQILSTFRFTQ